MFDQFMARVGIDFPPCLAGAVFLHIAALRPDDEIVEAHPPNLGPQFGRKITAQILDRRGAVGFGARFADMTVRRRLLAVSIPARTLRRPAVKFADNLDTRGDSPFG